MDPAVAARPGSSVETAITAVDAGGAAARFDRLATEEPMEIRLRAGEASRTVAITMRTPGHDFELAAGFLYNEGVIASAHDMRGITYCLDGEVEREQQYNIINVDLAAPVLPPLAALERHFTTTSACGVCGKASLEALQSHAAPIEEAFTVRYDTIVGLPDPLRERQRIFASTGGLHAAAIFDAGGALRAVREDVGRHNALDKLVGWAVIERKLPLSRSILLVSGRSSYEIVQKAVMARIPVVCSVSAPSSLAADLAQTFGVTLIGFLRGPRFNIYAHPQRIDVDRAR
jgi:FdhD protein